MRYSFTLACLAGGAFAFSSTIVSTSGDAPLVGAAMGRPETSTPVTTNTPFGATTRPFPETTPGLQTPGDFITRPFPETTPGLQTPGGFTTKPFPETTPGVQTPGGFTTTPFPTPVPTPAAGNGTIPSGPVTSTITYFDTQCGCTKTSVSVGPAKPTGDAYAAQTTTVINGVPCTIGAAPGGGAVVNGQTVAPGAAPTTIAGVPVNVVPGAGPSAATSVQIGTATVPVPTGSAGSSGPSSSSGSSGYSGSAGKPSNGNSTVPAMYTGGANANNKNVAGGIVGAVAVFAAACMA